MLEKNAKRDLQKATSVRTGSIELERPIVCQTHITEYAVDMAAIHATQSSS